MESSRQQDICTLDIDFEGDILKSFNSSPSDGVSLLHVSTSSKTVRLSATKVLHCLKKEQKLCIFVTFDYLLTKQKDVISNWKQGNSDYLVIVSMSIITSNKQNVLESLCLEINNVLLENSNKKAIVISERNDVFVKLLDENDAYIFKSLDDSIDFADLSQKSRDFILNKSVVFQVLLKSLLSNEDLQFCNGLMTDGCVEMLLSQDVTSIGAKLQDFSQYCVPHRLSRHSFLNLYILKLEMDVFAVTGVTIQELKQLVPSKENVGHACDAVVSESRFLVMDEVRAVQQYSELCQTRSNVHWLHMEGGKLEWMRSQANIRTIKRYLKSDKTTPVQSECVLRSRDKIVLIAGGLISDMFKPLHYLAQKAKDENPVTWVIQTQLDSELLNQELQLTCEQFLTSAAKIQSPLEQALFQISLKQTGNIVVLLDMSERLSPHDREKCCKLLMRLQETRVKKTVVAFHSSATVDLETCLSTIAFSSVELSECDQASFLHNFWTSSPLTEDQLKRLIKSTLSSINAVNNLEKVEIGIPLQTVIIAEIYHDYITDPTNNKLPETLDLINMLEQFVDKKFKIYFRNCTTSLSKHETKEIYLKDHMHAALSLFINKTNVHKLLRSQYHDISMNTNVFLTNIEKYPKQSGIITGVVDHSPCFIHPLFAAYFAGMCLTKYYESNEDFLKTHLYMDTLKVLRLMFDRILLKDHKLHMAVVNNDTLRVEALLTAVETDINSTDRGGRSALHLAASLGLDYSDRVCDYYDYCGRLIGPRPRHMVELLLEYGACLDVRDSVYHWTPLEFALKTTSWDAMEYLLARGANKDGLILPKHLFEDIEKFVDLNGCVNLLAFLLDSSLMLNINISVLTLLRKACLYGNLEIIKLLISRGADKRALHSGENLLHTAATRGQLSVIQTLLESYSSERVSDYFSSFNSFRKYIHTTNLSGQTGLHLASRYGFPEVVKLLISHGASMWAVDTRGWSSLHHACEGGDIRVAQILIESIGEKSDAVIFINKLNKDKAGRSALHLATWGGHSDIVALLVASGSDVGALDPLGRNCFHLAAWKGKLSVLQALLNNLGYDRESISTNINVLDQDGRTALHLASYWGYTDVIRLLILHGANTRALDNGGRSCFHLTSWRGGLSAVETVIHTLGDDKSSIASNINIRDSEGKSPLHLACYWGYSDIVECLIRTGGEVRVMDNEQRTCLHWAAMRHELTAAQVVIESLRDNKDSIDEYINVHDAHGCTARDIAMTAGRDEEKRVAWVAWLDRTLTENHHPTT